MKKIIFLFGVIFALCLINLISAINIQIDVNPTFSENQKIYFNYSIFSDVKEEISYVPQIVCKNIPLESLDKKDLTLEPNQEFDGIYEGFVVDDTIMSQNCKAILSIIEPIKFEEAKEFSIVTNPSFNFDIKLDKKVFYSGEEININYSSDIENPTISASLTYPDGTNQEIALPSLIDASQIGTYELMVIASREGYKTITKKEQFGVIETPTKTLGIMGINDASNCNADGMCNGNENNQNCPQDCPPILGLQESVQTGAKIILYLVIAFLILIFIVIAYIVLKKTKTLKKRKKKVK